MRLELYYAEEDVMEVEENQGFDPLKVWGMLNRLKDERGIDFKVIDVSSWSTVDLERAYEAAVIASVWNRYRIRKVFGTNSSSASFFGRGVPALLVFEGERPVHVFPHEEAGRVVTIRSFLEQMVTGRPGGEELLQRMDDLRKAIGPIGVSTSELVQEGRRR